MFNKKIIRTFSLELAPTDLQRKMLDETFKIVHERAKEHYWHLLAMRGEMVRIANYSGSKTTECKEEMFFAKILKTKLKNLDATAKKELKELFYLMIGKKHSRGFLSPMKNSNSKIGMKKTEKVNKIYVLFRKLLDKGVLAFKYDTDIPPSLDYAAWELAYSYLSGWHASNEQTKTNYKKETEKLKEMRDGLSDEDISVLNNFKKITDLVVNKKLVSKVKRYGFDVRYAKEELEEAKSIDPNINRWKKLFEYELQNNRLEKLLPDAKSTPPDKDNHVRQIPFGHNYVKFDIVQDDGKIMVKTKLYNGDVMVNVSIDLKGTGYCKDLVITPVSGKGSNYFRLEYSRGNTSELNETVVCELREIMLFRKNNKYYFYFPVSFTSSVSEVGELALQEYMSESKGPIQLPDGTRYVCADMGINPYWGFKCLEFKDGSPFEVSRMPIGCIKDVAYFKKVCCLKDDVDNLMCLIDYLKHIESGKNDIKEEIVKKRYSKSCEKFSISYPAKANELKSFVRKKIEIINSEFRQLKRYDVYQSRQRHLSKEQFFWVKTVKKLISLNKKWSYYGCPPVKKFESRPGFEKLSKYLKNIRTDLIKKIAQKLVYESRKHNASIIALEDLNFDKSSEDDHNSNELLSLWSPAMIRDWVNHFASQYGIVTLFLDPRNTSQIDPKTGEWGYRDKDNKENLWVIRDAKLTSIDADVDAATGNISNRFIDRVKNVYSLKSKHVSNPECLGLKRAWKPILEKFVKKDSVAPEDTKTAPEDGTSNKWKKSLLANHFIRNNGSDSVVINGDNGDVVIVDPLIYETLKTTGKSVVMYRHANKWLTKEQHFAKIENTFVRNQPI